MTNGDTEGRIFLSYPHMNNGLTIVFFTLKLASRSPWISLDAISHDDVTLT